MKRAWHHLRVRELVRPGHWVKKSKFYEVRRPSEAVEIYSNRARKNGVDFSVMWCEKDRRHRPERLAAQADRLWGDIRAEQEGQKRRRLGDVGDFLRLGGELFQELRQVEKEKVARRRSSNVKAKVESGS